MVDVMTVITKKNSLRALLRKMNLDQIDKLKADFNSIYNDIIEEKKEELRAEKERQRLIIEFKALMIESGISADDIVGNEETLKNKKKVKYRYLNKETGELHQWSGRGRPPAWVVEYELNGGNKYDLLTTD